MNDIAMQLHHVQFTENRHDRAYIRRFVIEDLLCAHLYHVEPVNALVALKMKLTELLYRFFVFWCQFQFCAVFQVLAGLPKYIVVH